MGALAVKEHDPMINELSTEQQDRVDNAAAAKAAVRSIPSEVKALGGNDRQALALADAMRLVLLEEDAAARTVLEKAGYPQDVIDAIMKHLGEGLKSAA
jgi:hypothetical protein